MVMKLARRQGPGCAVVIPTPRALGAVVRAHRSARGLTIEALADVAGVNHTYLSDIERGRGNPSVLKLGSIAVALDVQMSQLIAEAEDQTRASRAE